MEETGKRRIGETGKWRSGGVGYNMAAMWFALRRLLLGATLILAASTVLLLLDLDHRKPASGHPLGRKWKVTLIEYNQVVDVEESEHGVLEGLRASGLLEGRDYEIRMLNAQGDMATVSSLVDSAISDRTDLLITLSTPTLQAALKRAGQTPIVFTYLADAVAAGAGRSDTDHLPNVTGVYYRSAYTEMIRLIRELLPDAHTIGSLYVPSETNMVYHKGKLEEAAKASGIRLVTLPVNTSADVPDAAMALCSQDIDAICQIPGNMLAASFPSVASAANRAMLPIFAFQTAQVEGGAVLALARDYFDAGKESGLMAARVIRGENPGSIPFVGFAKSQLIVNLKAAHTLQLTLPPALVKQAVRVIGP